MTVLLTWNPSFGRPADFANEIRQLRRGMKPLWEDWSTGSRKNLPIGSRFFLFRQGVEPRGIVASGFTRGFPKSSGTPGDNAQYADIDFTMILDAEMEKIIGVSVLTADPVVGAVKWNNMPGSGVALTTDQAERLEELWASLLSRLGKCEMEVANKRQ